jgi:Family of unknown function (DUF6308)
MTLLPPNGFATIPEGALEVALAKTWDALDPELAIPRLRRYYDQTGDYAGATFVEAQPVIPDEFTAADLFALTLLSVDAPKPRVTRNFLDPGSRQDELLQLLRSAHLAGNQDLAHADDDTLLAMRQLYKTVKSTLGTNPWVTASKLCARKRPALFPVRDKLIRDYLDLTRYDNYEIDWQLFRAIMRNHEVETALHSLADIARGDSVHLDNYPLRWLDAALWMHARETTPRQKRNSRR